jgi:Lon protease-like protein
LITLTGISRFRIREELPLLEGYRRVVPEWREFARDLAGDDEPGFDRDRMLRGLRAYFQYHRIEADWDAITSVPGERLVTSIAMICPFEPSEKQALLEAPNLDERARLLTAMVEMAALNQTRDGPGARH